MNNIISSDFYRMRRGAALRNTCIALFVVIAMAMAGLLFIQSDFAAELIASPPGMSAAEAAELEKDIQDANQQVESIDGGAAFCMDMLGQSVIFFFFLPIVIAVFCADFSSGTYRNTLTYESNRIKVYMGKLLLSIGICIAMTIGMVIVSWLLGSLAFGFTGFTAAYFGRVLTVLLLQLPISLATIAVCHFLVVFTKKSGATIGTFVVGYIVLAIITQVIVGLFPSAQWAALLDPQSSGKLMTVFESAQTKHILFTVIYNLAVAAATTVLGALHFRKTDMP